MTQNVQGNGYTWDQTLNDVTVNIQLPSGTRAKELTIKYTEDKLFVAKNGQTIIDGTLHKPVKVSECTWSVEDSRTGRDLMITLDKKTKQEWWKCVIEGDQEVDTTQIQPENSKLSDLNSETRAVVEKMMFDQNQKSRGLPTSDELNQQEMLKKFMAQHPEMDFSQAQIQNGSSNMFQPPQPPPQ